MGGEFNFGGDNTGQITNGDHNTVSQRVEARPEREIDLTDERSDRAERPQASRIFISHAHADLALADPLVELLRLGVGAEPADIFCSSIQGQGIGAGERWLDVLANELNQTKLVVILITPAYLASTFCMCELGALWIKEIPSVPLVVPPVEIAGLSGILEQTQVLSIESPASIDQLGERAAEAVGKTVSLTEWARRRDAFLSARPEVAAP
ncbi:MAG: toll/interleukin-1 receptor domain-containing protein [Actinomycetota bacterium]